MALSEFEYKVQHLTDHLDRTTGADLVLDIDAKLGWDVQQIFTRTVGADEFVYVLMRRPRKKD